jgi:hypothetical protein
MYTFFEPGCTKMARTHIVKLVGYLLWHPLLLSGRHSAGGSASYSAHHLAHIVVPARSVKLVKTRTCVSVVLGINGLYPSRNYLWFPHLCLRNGPQRRSEKSPVPFSIYFPDVPRHADLQLVICIQSEGRDTPRCMLEYEVLVPNAHGKDLSQWVGEKRVMHSPGD